MVSINSTSEEVRSYSEVKALSNSLGFPLIQLPRKSEVEMLQTGAPASPVSINSTSEEVRSGCGGGEGRRHKFPLIQLPRKSEEWGSENLAPRGL